MSTAPAAVAKKLNRRLIVNPKDDTVLLVRAAKLIVAMKKCDGCEKKRVTS